MLYYSKSTGGFYDTAIHGDIPANAVEITEAEHAALLAAQASGQSIQAGEDGRPVAVARPAPDAGQLAIRIRAARDAKLTTCDWTQLTDSPLSAEAKAAWTVYRQALRDITAQEGFPWDGEISAVPWPAMPAT